MDNGIKMTYRRDRSQSLNILTRPVRNFARSQEEPETDLAVGQWGQLTPWPDLVNKVACF